MTIPVFTVIPNSSNPTTFAADMDSWLGQIDAWTTAVNAVGSAYGVSLIGTSTTSVAMGTGSKSLTTQTGLAFAAGQSIVIAYTTTPTTRLLCTVTSYNSGTGALVVNVDTSVGSGGPYTLWSISVTVAAAGVVTETGTATLSAKTLVDPVITGAIVEDVYAISDGASVDLDPANGTIQTWTLGANRTATATSFASGQSMTLMIADGTAYALTWPTVTWVTGFAPTLATSGYTVVELWKVSSTLYAAYVGDVA